MIVTLPWTNNATYSQFLYQTLSNLSTNVCRYLLKSKPFRAQLQRRGDIARGPRWGKINQPREPNRVGWCVQQPIQSVARRRVCLTFARDICTINLRDGNYYRYARPVQIRTRSWFVRANHREYRYYTGKWALRSKCRSLVGRKWRCDVGYQGNQVIYRSWVIKL